MEQNFKIAMVREGATKMTCQDAHCAHYENGWATMIDESSELGQRQAFWIRNAAARKYKEFPSEEAPEHMGESGANIPAGMTVFLFYPGQKCFQEHLDREVLFVAQKGRRGMATVGVGPIKARVPQFYAESSRVHVNPRDFNEHMNEEAEKAAAALGRG